MMKKSTKIYQQLNRVCRLLICGIGAWICLVGCSPKESEVLWSEVTSSTMPTEVTERDLNGIQQVDQPTDTSMLEKEPMEDTVTYATGAVSASASIDVQQSMIYVHVCGAVMNPSVVELPMGSRAMDALEAAGGFREDASRDYVNLAAEVADGQQLFFPTEEEAATMEELGIIGVANTTSNTANLAEGKVNINTADESTLCTLPGIGASKASAIIAYRQENGPFTAIEDIMKVSGIKTSAYERIQDKIVVQ